MKEIERDLGPRGIKSGDREVRVCRSWRGKTEERGKLGFSFFLMVMVGEANSRGDDFET